MNRDELWQWVDRASWSYHNLIGQTTTLPISLGGTGTSTVAGLSSSLGLSSMAYQASSNVAITGGSVSLLTYLSTAALSTGTARVLTNVSSATVSTGTLRATTNISSATVSTADLTGATRVSSLSVSTLSLYATTYVSTAAVSTNTLRAVTNVSSASVSTGNLFAFAGTLSSVVINGSAVGSSTASTGAFTTLSTSTFALAITTQVANLNSSTLQGQASSYYLATVNHFLSVTTITDANSPYTVTATDRYIRCSCVAAPITVLFPHASSFRRELYVKKIDATTSSVTISSVATDLFDGKVTTALASQWAAKSFINPVTGIWERLNVPTI